MTMMDSDSDYSTDTEPEDEPPESIDNIDTGEAPLRKSPRNSISSSHSNSTKPRAQLPRSLRQLSPHMKRLSRQLKGHDYDGNMSLHIVRCALQLQKDYLVEVGKVGNEKRSSVAKPFVQQNTCRLMGCSAATYTRIMQNYFCIQGRPL